MLWSESFNLTSLLDTCNHYEQKQNMQRKYLINGKVSKQQNMHYMTKTFLHAVNCFEPSSVKWYWYSGKLKHSYEISLSFLDFVIYIQPLDTYPSSALIGLQTAGHKFISGNSNYWRVTRCFFSPKLVIQVTWHFLWALLTFSGLQIEVNVGVHISKYSCLDTPRYLSLNHVGPVTIWLPFLFMALFTTYIWAELDILIHE